MIVSKYAVGGACLDRSTYLDVNFENYDIELNKYLKTNIIWLLDMSF